MTGPIRALAMARLRHRASMTALVAGPVAAAVALVAVVSGIGLGAADATLERALAETGPVRRVVARVALLVFGRRPQSGSGGLGDAWAARCLLDTAPPRRAIQGASGPIRGETFDHLVAVDRSKGLTTIAEGRLPAPCDGHPYEAILLSETAPSPAITVLQPAAGLDRRTPGSPEAVARITDFLGRAEH